MRILYALLSFFSRTANIVAAVLLMLSIAAFYINPDYFWPLAIIGLGYPILLIINIFFVFSWVLRRRWFFLLSFITILCSYPQLTALFAWGTVSEVNEGETKIRVMSYNVRNFDLYNWTKENGARQSMFDTIEAYNPDVLFFQEYYTDTNKFKNKEILEKLGYKYSSDAIELVKGGHRKWGVSVFSKFPMTKKGEIIRMQTPSPYGFYHNRGAYADLNINGQTIRVISVHLQSIHLGYEDYDAIDDLKEEQPSEWSKYFMIVKKLAKAFMQRGIQSVELHDFVAESPYPVILGGDFNDTPSSYAYQSASSHLKDAYREAGRGIGSTFNRIIPFLRIDYIFIAPSMRCTWIKIDGNPHSDHFPLVADIVFSTEKK